MMMKSEAEFSELAGGRCNTDPECKKFCPKCVSCNCLNHTCFCENPPLPDHTPPFCEWSDSDVINLN